MSEKILSQDQLRQMAMSLGKSYNNKATKFSLNGVEVSSNAIESAFVRQLQLLSGLDETTNTINIHRFSENQHRCFELMETAVDSALPKKVLQQYYRFVETKNFEENERPVFYQRITSSSRRRALRYVSLGSRAGIYNVFKLSGRDFDSKVFTVTGASELSFEDFITQRITFSDVMDIMLEGIDKRVQEEITGCLIGCIKNMQPANKHAATGFVKSEFDARVSIADSYGTAPSTIICTAEFARNLKPDFDAMSDRMKEEAYSKGGFLGMYDGRHPIAILDQSYKDETNMVKEMNDGLCFIIPNTAGHNGQPIKLGQIGKTHMRKIEDEATWGMRIDMFKTFSIALVVDNDICAYVDLSLTPENDDASSYGL